MKLVRALGGWPCLLPILAALAADAAPADRIDAPARMVLWYRQPGEKWLEGLPLGNGIVGAMVFGGVARERIALNEGTFWSGRPHVYDAPGARDAFPRIRDLVFAGRFQEAEKLADARFFGVPAAQQAYQPLGDLVLSFGGGDEAVDYRRELDLATGVARVRHRVGDAVMTREVFVSHPDRVMVVRIEADRPGRVSLEARFQGPYQDVATAAADTLVSDGTWRGPIPVENWLIAPVEGPGIRYRAALRAGAEGGRTVAAGDALRIEGADAVTLVVAVATSHVDEGDIGGDPAATCAATLEAVADTDHATLKRRHEADVRGLMDRVRLHVGEPAAEGRPVDERLRAVREGGRDPGLEALCFQFGRYLLVASSRPGGQPANLQGIWNESVSPPWGSKYTVNINTQMNYWPAEVCNLDECHRPLFDMLDDIAVTGANTARTCYGCRGWVTHHNVDLWRGTAPVDAARFGMWPVGGAWLCQHLWEHYRFSGDREFLAAAYPVMKGAARFLLDLLTEHPQRGWLVTPFSISPEHGFLDDDGELAFISPAPTMDVGIIRELFPNCIEASRVLGIDGEFRGELEAALPRLPPYRVDGRGHLQEWIEDWRPGDQGHDCSANFTFFPGSSIRLRRDPDLAAAIGRWMEPRRRRGGWPAAWDMGVWARLERGDRVGDLIQSFLRHSVAANLHNAGANQSDASFGFTAGVAEALLQSHADEISLLPALPAGWDDGSVSGLRARGGFEVDVAWHDGRLREARIRSDLGGPCVVRHGERTARLTLGRGAGVRLDANLVPIEQP